MDSEQLALRPISATRDGGGIVGGKVSAARERSSLAAASFRVYYSLRPGAVPFLWESTPGTPKVGGAGAAATASVSPAEMAAGIDAEVPPISPPPSYHSSLLTKGRRGCRARSSCSCPEGCVVGALLAALGIRRRARRRSASPL